MDPLAGLGLVCGVLSALYHKARTGEVSDVSASLLSAALQTCSETLAVEGASEPLPARQLDAMQFGLGFGHRIYPVQDGHIAVAALTGPAQQALREVCKADDDDRVESALNDWTIDEALAALGTAGVPAERVAMDNMDAFFDSKENRRTRLVVTTETQEYGHFEQVGAYWDFPGCALRLDDPIPALGEGADEALALIEWTS
jgi:crotonobetainyl-CoA:carnitine CoA-transferase CaiB-like acyl-CoA transferase